MNGAALPECGQASQQQIEVMCGHAPRKASGRVLRCSRLVRASTHGAAGSSYRPPRCSWLQGPSGPGLPLPPLTRIHFIQR